MIYIYIYTWESFPGYCRRTRPSATQPSSTKSIWSSPSQLQFWCNEFTVCVCVFVLIVFKEVWLERSAAHWSIRRQGVSSATSITSMSVNRKLPLNIRTSAAITCVFIQGVLWFVSPMEGFDKPRFWLWLTEAVLRWTPSPVMRHVPKKKVSQAPQRIFCSEQARRVNNRVQVRHQVCGNSA